MLIGFVSNERATCRWLCSVWEIRWTKIDWSTRQKRMQKSKVMKRMSVLSQRYESEFYIWNNSVGRELRICRLNLLPYGMFKKKNLCPDMTVHRLCAIRGRIWYNANRRVPQLHQSIFRYLVEYWNRKDYWISALDISREWIYLLLRYPWGVRTVAKYFTLSLDRA